MPLEITNKGVRNVRYLAECSHVVQETIKINMIDNEKELYKDSLDEHVEDTVDEEGVVTQENTENEVPKSD